MSLPALDTVIGAGRSLPEPADQFGVIAGEGIGREVTDVALSVLEAVNRTTSRPVHLVEGPTLSRSVSGELALSDELCNWYLQCRAAGLPVLHGPAGGRYVYDLRAAFNLFVKLTPVRAAPELSDASLLRPERVAGTDLLLVRDNSAGLYQGRFGSSDDGRSSFHSFSYTRDQIAAVMAVAVRVAEARSGRLVLVTKPGGIPTVSELWRIVAEETNANRVELSVLEIDNACYQLGSAPSQFDVLVSPNMFGDVLGDTASIALGSRGLSYSANFGADGFGVYQTAHGAAYDLADRNIANPIAHVSALAWLLESSLGRPQLAARIRAALTAVLAGGMRTADIAAANSTVLSTAQFGRHVADAISAGGD